jgi:tetratricopeptide (TPR) repeat protein/tRNA A-37 threonylcarbamoyl transferase component Bud32
MSSRPSEQSVFLHAIGLGSAADRAAYLDGACAGDPGLRADVEALLAAHDRLGAAPPPSTAGGPARPAETAEFAPPPGTGALVAGRYKLVERIGEGGMGEVWVAEQTHPVKRTVALKLIKAGMDSRQVVARFGAERQALALMDHPNIAKVLDAGTADDGHPFFVMELVRGVPITRFCDDRRLAVRGRLGLVADVCAAVQHAHQKGVIHRDLKPSNVLVTEVDGRPVVKVIDFGVAKAAGPRLTDESLATGFGALVGTLEYMSPEQAELNPLDVDTRSDVYALGVLLYELLTGTTPLTRERARGGALLDVLRAIREEEPPPPSARLAAADVAAVAAARGADPRRLAGQVRGEPDWIAMRCLEKDRARRYETAAAVGLDLRRHLADEPVSAGPPSARYRAGKFLRRNRGPVLAAALVLLALVAGVAVSAWQAVRATRAEGDAVAGWAAEAERRRDADNERERALEETRKAVKSAAEREAVLRYFRESVLAAARPRELEGGLGVDVTIRAALDWAEPQIANAFKDQPLVESEIRHVLGMTYMHLGEAKLAVRQLERAVELDRTHSGPDHEHTLAGMANLASVLDEAGRYHDAVRLYEETQRLMQAKFGPEHPDTLTNRNNLAHAYLNAGRLAEALPLSESTVKLMKEKLGPRHENTLKSMTTLAGAYDDAGRPADALAVTEEALELTRPLLGPKHPDTLRCMSTLAWDYRQTGRLEESVSLGEETLKLRKAVLGSAHPDTLQTMNNLAIAYWDIGRRKDGLRLTEETLTLSRARQGPEHPKTLQAMHNLAWVYQELGRLEQALPLFEQALKSRQTVLGADHPDTLYSTHFLARAYMADDRSDQAVPLLERAVEGRTKVLGPDHRYTLTSLNSLAAAYQTAGQIDKAVRLREQGLEKSKRILGPDHPDTLWGMLNLAFAYQRAGQVGRAVPLCEEALEKLRAVRGADHPETLTAMQNLAFVYQASGQSDKALPLYEESLEKKKAKLGFENVSTQKTLINLVDLYFATGQPARALSLLNDFLAAERKRLGPDASELSDHLARVGRLLLTRAAFPEAETVLRECLRIREKHIPDHWRAFNVRSMLGESLLGQNKYAEAESLLVRGYEGMKRREAMIPGDARDVLVEGLERLVKLYDAWDKPEQAAEWRKQLEAAKKPAAPKEP